MSYEVRKLTESHGQGDQEGVLLATLPLPGSHHVFMTNPLSSPESTILGVPMLQLTTYGVLGKSLILSSFSDEPKVLEYF